MDFCGISRVFSTVNAEQYETIGAFWDELSAVYGLCNLRGLGCNWTETTIEYVIGLKEGTIEHANFHMALPEDNWERVSGKTADLPELYARIYSRGRLKYEIETFTEAGDCEILYYR